MSYEVLQAVPKPALKAAVKIAHHLNFNEYLYILKLVRHAIYIYRN